MARDLFAAVQQALGDLYLLLREGRKQGRIDSRRMEALPELFAHEAGTDPQTVTDQLVTGGLCAVGSPVFDVQGQAIGFVHYEADQPLVLNDERTSLAAVSRPPILFTPASDLLGSLQDPPTGKRLALPWIGIVHANGLRKEVAEYFGLKGQAAIEIADVVPGAPADKAGLKAGMIIVKANGQQLERGDDPRELPMILNRQILRMKIGDVVKLTVLTAKGEPEKDFPVKLEEMPDRPSHAARYYAEDLGFVVRESVFMDTYLRRLPADAGGVVVAAIRPQGPAQTAKLEGGDLIVEINGQTVKNLATFRQFYDEARTAKPRDAVVLVVLRDGRNQTLRIEPPQ
jgi:serine protease Do